MLLLYFSVYNVSDFWIWQVWITFFPPKTNFSLVETCGMRSVWTPALSQWKKDHSESAESLWKQTLLLMSTDWLFMSSDLLMVILAWLLAACWMVKLTILWMYVYVCVPLTQWLMRLTSHNAQRTTQVSMSTYLHTHFFSTLQDYYIPFLQCWDLFFCTFHHWLLY